MDANGRQSTASNARSRHDSPRGRTKDKTHSVSGSLAKSYPGQTRSGAEGEGEIETVDDRQRRSAGSQDPELSGFSDLRCRGCRSRHGDGFSAAATIARRRDGRALNVSHTKFLSPISKLQPRPNPASCHFSCVQIEIELCSARNERKTGAEGEGEMIDAPS